VEELPVQRIFVLVTILLVAVSGQSADTKGESPPDPDLQKLQGKWRLTYHSVAGIEDTIGVVWELEVKGDKYTLKADSTTTTGTIKLDSSKKPKQLEYTAENDDDTMGTFVGIYELDADTYRTCDVEKGKDDRPTEFKTKAKTGQVVVWKKVKVKD
jgi:uncharacterized protein (TIGR03067 family)